MAIRQCSATTAKGRPCPIHADRMWDKKHYCHVHDPMGAFQQQQRGSPGSFANQLPEVRDMVLSLVRCDRETETYARLVSAKSDLVLRAAFTYLNDLHAAIARDLA